MPKPMSPPPSLRTDLLLAPRRLTAPPHHIGVCTAIKRLRCASKSFKHRASLGLHSTVEIVLHHTRPKSRASEWTKKRHPLPLDFRFSFTIFFPKCWQRPLKSARCALPNTFFYISHVSGDRKKDREHIEKIGDGNKCGVGRTKICMCDSKRGRHCNYANPNRLTFHSRRLMYNTWKYISYVVFFQHLSCLFNKLTEKIKGPG